MRSTRVIWAIPLLLAGSVASALGSEVRDKAGLFSPDAVKKANSELARIERETNVPVTIETVQTLQGRPIEDALKQLGRSEGIKGLFVLIAVKEHQNEADASPTYSRYFYRPMYQGIRESFVPDFKKGDFDAGLAAGLAKIETTLSAVKAEAGGTITPTPDHKAAVQPTRRAGAAPAAQNPVQGRSGVSMLIAIVVVIVVVMIGLRLVGALMGGGRGGAQGYGQGGMRGPGGYGAPGGGGGGGGFMSSLFGGIGGAMAGNWMYDQFSGRNRHGEGYAPPTQEGAPPAETGGDWGGGGGGDGGASWGDSGGGGGGDWGTGGGGGGGDWGGGGGGGDWGGGGGGGGDGGSW